MLKENILTLYTLKVSNNVSLTLYDE